ncbi:MAG TPA: phage tail tape measure protein [Sedimentisphaerales bacterium]|nr:phage tail tape measure protein [Sedimentisphaerales bacterium]
MARLRKEIILTENRIKHMVTGASRLSIAFERLGTVANKFGTVTSWIAIVAYAFSRAVGGTVSTLRTLDKTFSNVMKTTGLTRQELWALKNQFDQLNLDESMRTPTATKDLLEIARIAGRLGVRGVQNISDFTMAVDKLYVALGEDLQGSVEEVAEKVGKLVTTFRLTDNLDLGEAMLRAGSLINELSKSSAAGAVTILNYTSRLGGVGSMAKFSMDQLAGMGAALDAVGVPAERGSTALAKLITGMGEHAEEFARSLGMSTEEYRNAMETNINDTMLKLIQSSAQGNASIMDVVAGMDQMDVSGVRVMEVYGKLVQNMDLVIQQQAIARAAFSSSASVMNEFYIMSKDFDSLMAIQGKRWKALADDYAKAVAPSVYKVYRTFTDLAYAMRDVVGWIGRHINGLASLVMVWTAFKGVRIAELIRNIGVWIRVQAIELYRATIAATIHGNVVKMMGFAYKAAGGGIAGFGNVLKQLWITVKQNPFGLLITAASLVASAFFLFRKRTEELNDVLVNFNKEAENESRIMGELFERVKANAEGTDARREALNRLNTVYGQYLPRLLTEKDSIMEVEAAQKLANDALWESIALRVKETEIAEINQAMYDKSKKNISKILEGSIRINAIKDVSRYDKSLIASVEGQAEAELMILMRQMQSGGINMTAIDKFIKDWGIEGGSGKFFKESAQQKILGLFGVFSDGAEKIGAATNKLDSYITTLGKLTGKSKQENAAGFSMMSEADVEEGKKRIEMAATIRETELLKQQSDQKKSEEWLKKEQLKSEELKIRDLIQLEEDKWTKIVKVEKDGVIEQQKVRMNGIEASEDYVNLQNQLAKNLSEQGKPAGGGGGRKTQHQLDDEKAKLAVEKAEAEHNLKLAEIKRKYLEGAYLSEDEYNDKILEQEILFLDDKLKIYKVGSIEYAETYNALLEKKVQIEGNINDRILAAQKQFARIKTDRAVSEVDASLALEDERWAEEKAALESQLVVKSQLSEKEVQLNELYNKIIEAKELEHQEKIRRIKLGPQQAKLETMGKTIDFMKGAESDTTFTNRDQLKIILDERKKLIDKMYADELEMAGNNADAKLDADLKYVEANKQLQLDMFDAEQKMQLARVEMIQSYIGVLRNSVGEESKLGKALYLIGQGIAIAGIWIKVASDNAKIYSTALAEFAWMGPAAPAAAAAWAAAPMGANTANASLNTGLILAQTIGTVTQWAKGNYPVERVRQFAGGKFPVMGKDDGRTYDAEYVGPVKTGVYKKPSLGLFAERPEMVIDYPTLRNIQMNNPKLIEAILAHRVVNGTKQQPAVTDGGARQFAKGNYQSGTGGVGLADAELKELIRKNIEVNERMMKWKPKVYTEMIRKDLETLERIDRNRSL